jgi:hypothetical protein
MRLTLLLASLAAVAAIVVAGPAGATTSKGFLFHDGATVGTVVTPVAIPNAGLDPLYEVTNGAAGQLGVTAVAPGDGPYHGGAWAVSLVTFKAGVTPYVLTSDEAVLAAEAAGDVTVTRAPAMDFRCPVTRP